MEELSSGTPSDDWCLLSRSLLAASVVVKNEVNPSDDELLAVAVGTSAFCSSVMDGCCKSFWFGIGCCGTDTLCARKKGRTAYI